VSTVKYNILDSVFYVFYLMGAFIFSVYLVAAKSNHIELGDVGQVLQALSTKAAFRTSVFDSNASSYPIITKVRGDLILHDPKKGSRKPVVGDFFTYGMTLETKNGTAVFKFGDSYLARVRVEKNSKISFDSLMKKDPATKIEKTVIVLDRGLISFNLDNPKVADITINTKTASLVNKGTKLALYADEDDFALIFTGGGSVDSESFASLQKYTIPQGNIYLISRTRGEKTVTKSDIISQFNWDLEYIEIPVANDDILASLLNSSAVVTSISPTTPTPTTPASTQPVDPNTPVIPAASTNPATTPATATSPTLPSAPSTISIAQKVAQTGSETWPARLSNTEASDKNEESKLNEMLKQKVQTEMESFKKYDQELAINLANATKLVNELKVKIEIEKSKIEKDKTCLGVSSEDCNLYSESILRERGFTQMTGNKAFREKLINELTTYMNENAKSLEENKKIATDLPALISKRAEVLRDAQRQFDSGKDLASIIDKLNNHELFEK
jgi:hypothetical protein